MALFRKRKSRATRRAEARALKAKAKVFVHPKLFTDELDRLVQPEPDEALLSEEERAERLKKFLEGISPTDFGRLEF